MEDAKDINFMPRSLEDALNAGDFTKALKISQQKMSKGNKNSLFFAVMTAYCLLKGEKLVECQEVLLEYKGIKPSDSITTKYLIIIYNQL